MDLIINFALWLGTVFTRSRDRYVAEHRRLQRHCVVSAATAVVSVAFSMLVMSVLSETANLRPMLQPISVSYLLFFLLAVVVSCTWLIWSVFALWRFEQGR